MTDLLKGYTFSGTNPNNIVTAEKLNALVDEAAIQPGFYTERAETTAAAADDLVLLYSAAAGAFQKIRSRNLVTAGIAKSGFTKLVVNNNAANPNTRIDVNAKEVVVRSATGGVRHVTSFVRTLDSAAWTGVATADGRDFATLNADTWYYVWAISDGTNDRLLLSTSATSPVLPAGYIYQALLSAVRFDHGSHLVRFIQRDAEVAIAVASKAGDASAYLNPKTGATPVEFTDVSCDALKSFQAADLSQCIPLIATRVHGTIGQSTDAASATYVYAIAAKGSGAIDGANVPTELIGLQILTAHAAATAIQMFGFFSAASFELTLQSPQTLYWTASAGAARHNLRIHGFRLGI